MSKPSSLTRRSLLQGAASLAAASALPASAWAAPHSVAQPVPSGSPATGTLKVSPTPVARVPQGYMGFCYEKFRLDGDYFRTDNRDMVALFKLLGVGVLRIGGDTMDKCVWSPNGNGKTYLEVSPGNVDELARFLNEVGWSCMYGVALAKNTPELAAAEVAYVAKALGPRLYAIEIGNEPDGYPGPGYGYRNATWALTGSDPNFLDQWEALRAAIVAKTPSVRIAGPGTGGADHKRVEAWTVPFVQDPRVKGKIAMVTQHYYRANGKDPKSTIDVMLSKDDKLATCLALVREAVKSSNPPLGYRLGECNNFYHGGAKDVSNSYASALWAVDFLFTAALGGVIGINMHGGGDHDFYSFISDHNGKITEINPEFYGMLLFQLATQCSDPKGSLLLQTTLDGRIAKMNVAGYSVKMSDGSTNVVLINKEDKDPLHVTITAERPSIRSATAMEMTGPSLAATSGALIQGAEVKTSGEFKPEPAYALEVKGGTTSCYVPAHGAVLVKIV